MILFRAAWDGCQSLLAEFECSHGEESQENVQDWIRSEAWAWSQSGEDDPRLLLMLMEYEEQRVLMGVVAHEAMAANSRFLPVLAVRHDRQGERWGSNLFKTATYDAARRCQHPGFATWLVDPANLRAAGFFEHLGADCQYPPEDKPFIRFRFDLDPPAT